MNAVALEPISVRTARLPAVYSAARDALEKCARIDECREWANKAEALASYAKQSRDKALHHFADRVRARAIRRCGELLNEIEPAKNQHAGARVDAHPSRTKASKDAGLSRHQKRTALRVANVPAEEFESAVESDEPPTVTELAERGKKESTAHLRGRNPKDFAASTQIQGQLRYFAEDVASWDIDAGLRGAFDDDIVQMRFNANAIVKRLTSLINRIESRRRK